MSPYTVEQHHYYCTSMHDVTKFWSEVFMLQIDSGYINSNVYYHGM